MQSTPSIRVKQVEGFSVKGFHVKTKNSDEFNEKTAQIPSLWQQFYASGLTNLNASIFGVYSDYDTDEQGPYSITVGTQSNVSDEKNTLDESQLKLHTVQVQTGHYLVFEGKGPMPDTVIETWQQVWKYFEKTDTYQRNFISDFEAYISADEVAIYIGIQ
ncbi:MAG: GyrI-like domain-containing protein [Legionellaceae bacterium]|nr:GyrI-like domain-containing protein [Legionellaceae bacterium]